MTILRSKHKCFLVALLILLLLVNSGCWGRRETGDLAIVGSIGLDLIEPDDEEVLVSLEIVNPDALAVGPQRPPGGPQVAWIIREQATSASNAIAAMQRRTPRWLFLGQISTLVVGQTLARRGILPYLDFFVRHGEFRRTIALNVCDSASGLLQRPFIEELPSRTLDGLMLAVPASGQTTTVDLNEFLRALSEPGIEPIAVHTVGRETKDLIIKDIGEELQQEEPAESRDEPMEAGEELPAMLPPDAPILDPIPERGTAELMPGMTIMVGLAAFRDDRLVGFLDGYDARGYLWVAGRMYKGHFELSTLFWDGGTIGLHLVRLNTRFSPVVRDGELMGMQVSVQPDFQVVEVMSPISLGEPGVIDDIENALNRAIEAEIDRSLEIIRHFQSDIYGFGQSLFRAHPKIWEEMEGDWNEEHFPNLTIDVEVRSRVRGAETLLRE